MLIKFLCYNCKSVFYVDDEDKYDVKYCPICRNTEIIEKDTD